MSFTNVSGVSSRGIIPAKRANTGIVSSDPTQQTGTPPDQFSEVVQRARRVLAQSQSGLASKAASNTAGNTNIEKLDKTIGDLADLVESTFDPVWKETYRVTLVRCLAAAEKAKQNVSDVEMNSQAINDSGLRPDTFAHPAVGLVSGLDVSSWSARQAGYQQRFNPPPRAEFPPDLPVDPAAAGNEYNQRDIPGQGTTAMPTQTNPTGSFFGHRSNKQLGYSHR